ncbi:MAG: hypothetical protein LAO31_06735 [Acidobacteriia bacterium]|nr:hypothetical protein [Terriglobia bacterium]
MPQFLTSTVISCLNRQDVEALIKDLRAPSPQVKLDKAWGSTAEGKLICLFSTGDRATLQQFLKLKHVHTEWIVNVETEWNP